MALLSPRIQLVANILLSYCCQSCHQMEWNNMLFRLNSSSWTCTSWTCYNLPIIYHGIPASFHPTLFWKPVNQSISMVIINQLLVLRKFIQFHMYVLNRRERKCEKALYYQLYSILQEIFRNKSHCWRNTKAYLHHHLILEPAMFPPPFRVYSTSNI